eukprot:11443231-Heterocapsa_arctica.AAC.1
MLCALLQARCCGRPLPYVAQVHADLARLSEMSCELRRCLPPVEDRPAAWLELMAGDPRRWCVMVNHCAYVGSILDPVAAVVLPCMP